MQPRGYVFKDKAQSLQTYRQTGA